MTSPFKPQDYNSVSVYLMSAEPEALIDFLSAAFGARLLRRFDRPDGTLAHAEVQIDDTVVMLGGKSVETPPFPVWLHVYVPDVDETYRRALAAGGRSVQQPAKGDDPDKRGGVMDPAGNTWWIATSDEIRD